MGQVLKQKRLKFKFIFVGEKQNIIKKPGFPLTFTKNHYVPGTLEYLQWLTSRK
jgi:hypothetical protein